MSILRFAARDPGRASGMRFERFDRTTSEWIEFDLKEDRDSQPSP
jgi:hypothetical protein